MDVCSSEKGLLPKSEHLTQHFSLGCKLIRSDDGSNENLLIFLHGLGDNPGNFGKFASKLHLPATACLIPKGPVPLPDHPSGTAWFRTLNSEWLPLQAAEVLANATHAVNQLEELLRCLHEKARWPYSRLHLFGFSQGGSLALETTKHFRDREALGGAVSISGPLLMFDTSSVQAGQKCSPVLLTSGSRDQEIKESCFRDSMDTLKRHGCQAKALVVEGKGHAMIEGETEMRAVMQFWASTLKTVAPPSDDFGSVIEVEGRH